MSLLRADENQVKGVLADFRRGRRGLSLGVSMGFWLFVGAAVGVAVGRFLVDVELWITLGPLGAVLGFCVGCFAAFGSSRLARILDAPAVLLTFLPF